MVGHYFQRKFPRVAGELPSETITDETSRIRENLLPDYIDETLTWRRFQPILIWKTIVGHFLSDRDAYMTTHFPDINACIHIE
jgi:hypothetical protein